MKTKQKKRVLNGDIPRQNVKTRKQKKKIKLKVAGLVSIFLIIGVFVVLSLTVFFPVDTIVVVNESQYSDEDVTKSSEIQLGNNIFTVDRKNVSKLIATQLPMIEKADISLKLPSTIVITTHNVVPKYLLLTNDRQAILSDKGKVLSFENSSQNDLIQLIGFKVEQLGISSEVVFENDKVEDMLFDLEKSITKIGLNNILSITIDKGFSFYLNYNNRVTIKIGIASNIDEKLKNAKVILEEYEQTEKGTLDMSTDPNKAVFTPENEDSGKIILPN